MLLGDPGKDYYGLRPPLYFFPQQTPLRLSVPDVTPQVPVSCRCPDPEAPKLLLFPGYVPLGYDQDALGRLWVVAAGWYPRL